MRVFISQVYIEPGITFPFTHHFQRLMAESLTSLVLPSTEFEKRYGPDWDVIIRMSAKAGIEANEIRGPSVFKKAKDVEYSVFLPFSAISKDQEPLRSALSFLFSGVCFALEALFLDTSHLKKGEQDIVQAILSDPSMIKVT